MGNGKQADYCISYIRDIIINAMAAPAAPVHRTSRVRWVVVALNRQADRRRHTKPIRDYSVAMLLD